MVIAYAGADDALIVTMTRLLGLCWTYDYERTPALTPEQEGVSCHALHHSAATWGRAGGARLDAISGMLGHADMTTTSIYARIVDRIAENPARYLEELTGLCQTKHTLVRS